MDEEIEQAGKAEQNSQSDQGGLESKAEGKEEQKTIVQNQNTNEQKGVEK